MVRESQVVADIEESLTNLIQRTESRRREGNLKLVEVIMLRVSGVLLAELRTGSFNNGLAWIPPRENGL